MPSDPTLPQRAVARLQQLADGNGLNPDDIKIQEQSQKQIVLKGDLRLTPRFEVDRKKGTGAIKNAKAVMLGSIGALTEEVSRRKTSFEASKTIVQEVVQELKQDQTLGWGFNEALVSLPSFSATLAATDPCPSCGGRGQTVCQACNGQRQTHCPYCEMRREEPCYHCNTTGHDPARPDMPCPVCHGSRMAPCRYCNATGMIPCPHCQGKGGTKCATCRATGKVSEIVKIQAGAMTNFKLQKPGDLPSTLLRALDNLGMSALGKGHADIQILDQPEGGDPNLIPMSASFDFAEVKIVIGKSQASFGILGKKNALLGVPTFLDRSLKPYLDQLKEANKAPSSLHKATEARAIKDAVRLVASGDRNPVSLRKLYPYGLSGAFAKDVMKAAEGAVARLTFSAQIVAGLLVSFLMAGLVEANNGLGMMPPQSAVFILSVLGLFLGWLATSSAAGFVLRKKIEGAMPRTLVKPTPYALALTALATIVPVALHFVQKM